jgi:hypothetical protein
VQFRNIQLQNLPSTDPAAYEIARVDRGCTSLYNGTDLSDHWEMEGVPKRKEIGN